MKKWADIDIFLRVVAVVFGIIAAPLIFLVGGMATDSGTQKAYQAGQMVILGLGGLDVLGVVCAFVPRYEEPIEGKQLFLYLLLRLPTYAIVVGGVVTLWFVLFRA